MRAGGNAWLIEAPQKILIFKSRIRKKREKSFQKPGYSMKNSLSECKSKKYVYYNERKKIWKITRICHNTKQYKKLNVSNVTHFYIINVFSFIFFFLLLRRDILMKNGIFHKKRKRRKFPEEKFLFNMLHKDLFFWIMKLIFLKNFIKLPVKNSFLVIFHILVWCLDL